MHVSVLKRYHSPTMAGREAPSKPEPEIVEGGVEYKVEEIVDSRIRYGKKEYLIKWVGYESCDNTWEKSKNLVNTKEAIMEFENSKKFKKKL